MKHGLPGGCKTEPISNVKAVHDVLSTDVRLHPN
jgi:hypothetical protein